MVKIGEPIKGMSKEERSAILEKPGITMSHREQGDIARKKPKRRRNKTR